MFFQMAINNFENRLVCGNLEENTIWIAINIMHS